MMSGSTPRKAVEHVWLLMSFCIICTAVHKPVSAEEILLCDTTITIPSFWTTFIPCPLRNWKSPVNYWEGNAYNRFEVISMASDRDINFHWCAYTDNGGNHDCSDCCRLTDEGQIEYYDHPLPGWWNHNGYDFTQVDQIWPLVHRDVCGDDRTDDEKALYFPFTVKMTVVLVSAGATFSGWENYEATPVRRGTNASAGGMLPVIYLTRNPRSGEIVMKSAHPAAYTLDIFTCRGARLATVESDNTGTVRLNSDALGSGAYIGRIGGEIVRVNTIIVR